MSRYNPLHNFGSFMDQLRAMPPHAQFNFASGYLIGYQTIGAFSDFVEALPAELKPSIALAHAARFVDKIENKYHLLQLLNTLPVGFRAAFAQREGCLAKIQNASEVEDILAFLPASSRMAYAISARAHLTNPKHDLMRIFEEEDIRIFLNKCLDAIKDGDDLAHVLDWLDSSSRSEFAEPHLAKIKDGLELYNLLKVLPIASRVDIATRCLDKIQNTEQLFLMIETFNDSDVRGDSEIYEQVQTFMLSPAYLAKIEEFFRKIETVNDVCKLLECLLPSSQGAFAERAECIAQIHNAIELMAVLRLLPDGSVLGVAEACATKIDTMDFLLYVLERLPVDSRHDFLLKPFLRAKIENGYELANVLQKLPLDSRYALALDLRSRIQNGGELGSVLSELFVSTAPKSEVFAFADLCRNKIKTTEEMAGIFLIKEFQDLGIEQKISFIDGCNPKFRLDSLLAAKCYLRTLFDDPFVQQKFSLRELDPSVFLFQAAADPLREADFDYFLAQALCSVDALNEAAKTLVMHIEEQEDLSRELKDSRIARVRAQQERKRKNNAGQHLGFNLSTLKQTELKFTRELPAVEPEVWPQAGLDPTCIQRFRQLIQWLKTQPALVACQADFAALESNTLIRARAQTFNSIVGELENFVATLALYLSQRKSALNEADRRAQEGALASHLDASAQLGLCMEGVRSSLQSMTRSLNPGSGLVNAVDIAVDQATRVFVDLAGIPQDMEVHVSKDWLLLQLCIDSRIHHDPYRLAISPVYLRAIARNAAGRLTPDFLMEQSLPNLESLQEAPLMVFNSATINLLERDWYALHTAGLLPENRSTAVDRCADVMCFIDDTLSTAEAYAMIEKYQNENNQKQPVLVNLCPETLQARYRRALETSGFLSIKADDIAEIKTCVWAILTTNEANLSSYDDFLKRILNAPNGLAWVKSVIEPHTEVERREIKLRVLLHCPKDSSQSLFRALACDPYSAGWLMAWELRRADAVLSFNPSDTGFLGSAIGELVADTTLMHKELEEIFVRPGNLLFWLGELQKDAPRRSIFDCVMTFISAKGMYRFDSLLGALAEMSKKGDDFEKTTAQSFLAARCEEQRAQKLWNCYWKTACYLENAELKFDSLEMLQSLKDPETARAALAIVRSNQALVLKITQALATIALSREDYAAIVSTIAGLFPVPALLGGAGAGAGAGIDDSASSRMSP